MEFLYLITGLTVGGIIAFVLLKNKTNEIYALQQERIQAAAKQEQLQLQLKEKEIELRMEISQIENTITNLKDGEICQSCKRPLEGVDHKKEIADNEKMLKTKKTAYAKTTKEIERLSEIIESYDKLKALWDEYNKTELLLENKD